MNARCLESREPRRRAFRASAFTLAFALGAPQLALAAECPPDEWFCEPETSPSEPGGESAAPSPEAPSSEPDSRDPNSAPASPESPLIDLETGPPEPVEPGDKAQASSKWSANLHVQGVMLEQRPGRGTAGLGGVGGSLRYRVHPVVTLEIGVDSLLGTDYEGYDRSEQLVSFGSLLYLNPLRPVQTYVILGFHSSVAHVEVDGVGQSWSYLGAQGGLGVEIPFDWRVALNLDLIAFVRGRTDSRAERQPEFTDDDGRVSNTSGGGLFRAGVSLRW